MNRRGIPVALSSFLPEAPSCHRVLLVLAGVCLVLQLMLVQAVFHHHHPLGAGGHIGGCIACQVATSCLADSPPKLASPEVVLPDPVYVIPGPEVSHSILTLFSLHRDRAPPTA